jgi:hypothetical protein
VQPPVPSRPPLLRATRRAAVVVAAVAALALASAHPVIAPRAEAATTVLRPDTDITNSWQVAPGGAAYAAVDDPVAQPTAVPATDWLYAGAAGRAVELGTSSTPLGTNVVTAARVWFHANTGPGTQLRVEAVWSGGVRASTVVPAGEGFAWRSLAIAPSAPSDVADLRLRFTAVGGGDTNLRATYATVDTAPPAAPLRTLTWDDPTQLTLPAPPPGWNRQYVPDRGAQLVTSPVRAGSRAARFELRSTDPLQNASRRSELTTSYPEAAGAGVERWYGFSVQVPVAPDAAPEILAQWHHVGDNGSPPLSIGTRDGQWEVALFNGTGGASTFALGAYPADRWTDWVVRVRWTSATNGLIEIWRDGALVFSRYGVRTNYDDLGVYPKLGVYRWTWATNPPSTELTRVVLHDEMRIGDSAAGYAGVAPR